MRALSRGDLCVYSFVDTISVLVPQGMNNCYIHLFIINQKTAHLAMICLFSLTKIIHRLLLCLERHLPTGVGGGELAVEGVRGASKNKRRDVKSMDVKS